jgi:hypothetical protein
MSTTKRSRLSKCECIAEAKPATKTQVSSKFGFVANSNSPVPLNDAHVCCCSHCAASRSARKQYESKRRTQAIVILYDAAVCSHGGSALHQTQENVRTTRKKSAMDGAHTISKCCKVGSSVVRLYGAAAGEAK